MGGIVAPCRNPGGARRTHHARVKFDLVLELDDGDLHVRVALETEVIVVDDRHMVLIDHEHALKLYQRAVSSCQPREVHGFNTFGYIAGTLTI